MSRRPEVNEDELFEIATYLKTPRVETEFHAELHPSKQREFELEYARATNGYPLPAPGRNPYYIWPPTVNKYGMQLRIYFKRVPPEPPTIRTLYTDYGKWQVRRNMYRINHSNLVMQLFRCGFVLGTPQDQHRIELFMRDRFPVRN